MSIAGHSHRSAGYGFAARCRKDQVAGAQSGETCADLLARNSEPDGFPVRTVGLGYFGQLNRAGRRTLLGGEAQRIQIGPPQLGSIFAKACATARRAETITAASRATNIAAAGTLDKLRAKGNTWSSSKT